MPIFEYQCEKCSETFEKLVVNGEEVNCPSCSSDRLSKQYSRFGMAKGSGPYESLPMYKGGGGCGCTPSSCGCKN